MNLSPNELRIFSILHHFNDELEKIASFRSHPAYLRGRIKGLGRKIEGVKETLGPWGKVPGTDAHKAVRGATSEYKGRRDALEAVLRKRKNKAMKDLQEGKNVEEALREIRAQQARPKKVEKMKKGPPGSAPLDDAKHWLKTDEGRRAALLGTGTALGAAGLYAGQKYLSERDQGGGYGGY